MRVCESHAFQSLYVEMSIQQQAKFAPQWEARYLVTPGGLVVPRVLTSLSLLVAGGARQLFTK